LSPPARSVVPHLTAAILARSRSWSETASSRQCSLDHQRDMCRGYQAAAFAPRIK
jgi:hypothetical protein